MMKTDVKHAAHHLLDALPESEKLELLAKSRFSCECRTQQSDLTPVLQ